MTSQTNTKSPVKLQSKDGLIFDVDVEVASKFGVIKSLIQTNPVENSDEVIPIFNVESTILKKLIEWHEYHKNEEANKKKDKESEMTEWNSRFFETEWPSIFELILAANYLDAEKFLNEACKRVADQMQKKPLEDVAKEFDIDIRPVDKEAN